MKVREHLVYYALLSGLDDAAAGAAAARWLDRLGLSERAQDTVQSLSSGNQQRVQLAPADPGRAVLGPRPDRSGHIDPG